MNENSQRQRDNAIRVILANWKITHLDQAFPASIKPVSLGNSSISQIKSLSTRKSLAEAQALFLDACQNDDGQPISLGFAHTDRVWKAVKDAASAPEEDDDEGEEKLSKSKL